MTTPIETQTIDLSIKFPGTVTADERENYTGWIVAKDALLEVALFIRDELGYDLLSSVTGVDYLEEQKMEVVYHAYKTTGGTALVFKVQLPRTDPIETPSLIEIWRGVDFQEREIWDLYGIKFIGHPDLRRILTWEGFAGHPLRKDWKEPFHEDETKPFKSRWPEGNHTSAEERTPYNDNIQFPDQFDPEKWTPTNPEEALYTSLKKYVVPSDDGLQTEQIVLNMGPHHPSMHGVFRAVILLDGEHISSLKPVMGYLHRNHEKIGERNTYLQNMPFTDRLDYFNSMANNWGYALAVEKMMGIQAPERAEYIRVIMAEISRIQNHFIWIGMMLNDLGAFFTPALYAFEERELILDIFEAVAGSRMMCNYHRFGGVVRDVDESSLRKLKDLVFDRIPRKIDEFERLLTDSELFLSRMIGVSTISAEEAIAHSVTGPILRATGIPYDIRKAEPYGIYDRFDFNIPTRQEGDMYARYLVRVSEMRESLRILEQAIQQIPEGPVLAGRPVYQVRVPAGEAYSRIESPKGELGFYLISNGSPNPYRYHVRAPSFVNLTILERMCVGTKVADFVAILGTMDIVLGELDR